jgi:hypothetical protein
MSSTTWSTSCLVVLTRCTRSAVWHHAIGSLGTLATPSEWSTGSMMHCSCISTHLLGIKCAAYPHVLHAHYDPDVRHLRNMCACVENMWVYLHRLFFMLVTRGPHGTTGYVVARGCIPWPRIQLCKMQQQGLISLESWKDERVRCQEYENGSSMLQIHSQQSPLNLNASN